MKIKILVEDQVFIAELNESETAQAVYNKLPIQSKVNTWGNEIYFSTPVSAELEADAKTVLEVGELAFYPPMNAFCIFFGPTPASATNKPEAAGPVSVFGKIINCDVEALQSVSDGVSIFVEKAE